MKNESLTVYLIKYVLMSVCLCAFCFFCFFRCAGGDTRTVQTAAGAVFPVIIIDAGHGGEDGGASGFGLVEKELNLDISVKLKELFETFGYTAVMTRTTDRLMYTEEQNIKGQRKMHDLKNRLEIANEYENAVFVSIHMNKFSVEKYSGLQVYYSQNNPESAELAEAIQGYTAEYLQPENTRKTKPAGSNIYLLDKNEKPAVMVECGFLSNAAECANLSDDGYRQKLALVIFAAIYDTIAVETSPQV